MIELRKVDSNNIWEIIKLSVNNNQLNFVATNTKSILQAYTTITSGGVALPFGIYNDDTLVGFVMFGYGTNSDDDGPAIAAGNYCIWRFMIDKTYQGQGLGKKALQASIEYLRSEPCGRAAYCWLSYEPENVVARALYNSMGFFENGQMCGEEIVAAMHL
jgi:diamine N-acetyltransferase